MRLSPLGKKRQFRLAVSLLASGFPNNASASATTTTAAFTTTAWATTRRPFVAAAAAAAKDRMTFQQQPQQPMVMRTRMRVLEDTDTAALRRSQYSGRLWMSSSAATPVENNTNNDNDSTSLSSSSSSSWDEPEAEDGNNNDNESRSVEGGEEEEEEDLSCPLSAEHGRWSEALENAIQSLKKKRTSLESELAKAQGVEGTVARAQLLVSNLYLFSTPRVKSATVQDWEQEGLEVELVLDPKYDSAAAEADALFVQVRKLKRGSQVVSDLLETTANAWELLQEAHVDLQSARNDNNTQEGLVDPGRLALVQDRLIRSSRATNFKIPNDDDQNPSSNTTKKSSSSAASRPRKPQVGTPASNLRKLESPGGCTVLVGRNRRGNEHLSLNLARGKDIWMHSRGCPGAHVVVQHRRGGPTPTDACLQFAADVAIFYSDLRAEAKAPVTAAEPKHLQKPRGAPLGAIKVREELQTYVGRPDRVPEALKVAREESGQSEEYRSQDKAKHHRRTKKSAKEDKAKRKKAMKDK
jgi:hypothetical protein